MASTVETIEHGGTRYAIVIRNTQCDSGVQFFTPDDAELQLGAFHLAKGHEIPSHVHQKCERQLSHTSEVLVIQAGKLQVDFYDAQQLYLESRILDAGDTVLLFDGGHGFTILEDLRMLEIKQGPYTGIDDKVRFRREPYRAANNE